MKILVKVWRYCMIYIMNCILLYDCSGDIFKSDMEFFLYLMGYWLMSGVLVLRGIIL